MSSLTTTLPAGFSASDAVRLPHAAPEAAPFAAQGAVSTRITTRYTIGADAHSITQIEIIDHRQEGAKGQPSDAARQRYDSGASVELSETTRPQLLLSPSEEMAVFTAAYAQESGAQIHANAPPANPTDAARPTLAAQAQRAAATTYATNNDLIYHANPLFDALA